MRAWLAIVGLAVAVRGALALLPEAWIVRALCTVPAWGVAWWHGVAVAPGLRLEVGTQSFVMTRACAAEGFLALLVAVVAVRRWRWLWGVYPAALLTNMLRIIATTSLACALPGFRYERLLHMVTGLSCFLGALALVWILTETKGTSHDTLPRPR